MDPNRVPNLTLKQYQPLVDLLLEPSQTLVGVLCDTTDLCDGDKLAKQLFHIFEAQGQTTLLLRESIAHEIRKCSKSTLLFRNNSICSKMLTVWARLLGVEYLRTAVGACIEGLNNSTESFEVDPNRGKEGIDLAANMKHLEEHVTRFFTSILASEQSCPTQVKQICYYLQQLTLKKFSDAGYFVVAGFIFLRFICPAIVTPPSYNLLATFPKKDSHRGLVLVAKVLQNLANGVDFKKEPYMMPLNPFLENNQQNFKNFIDSLSASENPTGPDLGGLNQTPQAQQANLSDFHQFLMKNIARVTDVLNNTPETTEAEKQAAAKLRELLVSFELLEKADSSGGKDKKSGSDINLLADTILVRDVVLNADRQWVDSVRPAVAIGIDLLTRAKLLCENNPVIMMGAATKGPVHPIDWQGISDSVDYSEFALDTAELQKIDVTKLTNQKDLLAFWINVVNIMVIHIHVVNGPPNSKLRRRSMFQSYKYDIAGQQFCIDDIIEGVLRGNPKGHFKKKDPRVDFCMQHYDPRFHFGISYLIFSSPQMRVLRSETISQQLNFAAEEYLREEVSIVDKKKIRLPHILEKYYQDFGVYNTDIFQWLARYLEPERCQELGLLIASGHYSFDYAETSWEPRRGVLFARDFNIQPRSSHSDQFAKEYPVDAILDRCKTCSVPATKNDGADELGLLNFEVKWTADSRHPLVLSIALLRYVQGLCQIHLFDWGSIAGSAEFRAFLVNTAELQKADLKELQRHEALPFWVNMYHVLLLHLYIMKRPPASMSVFVRKTFFTTYKYNIGGCEYSLKDIEEGVLRGHVNKHFKPKDERAKYAIKTDPRAAFMLSLATKTSPAIRAYKGEDIENVETRATELFLRDTVRVDLEKKKLTLPDKAKEIYENDFRGKKEELVMWMSQFLSPEQQRQLEQLHAMKKFSIAFDDFDWTPHPVFEQI